MNLTQRFIFTRHNAIYLAICLTGLLILVGASILPLRNKQASLRQELDRLEGEVASQRQNQTSVVMVDSLVAKLDQQPTPQVVPTEPLAQDKTGQIADDVRAIAQAHTLAVDLVEPQLKTASGNWQAVTVKAEVRGQFADLRGFLLQMLALPYVTRINRLEIHADRAALRFLLTYTVALA